MRSRAPLATWIVRNNRLCVVFWYGLRWLGDHRSAPNTRCPTVHLSDDSTQWPTPGWHGVSRDEQQLVDSG
jgi:hypothetical protein